ncbi:MAG TPA: FimV/HubP family polar landmark protein [Gammaproteobacteria bacterium]
MRRYLGLTLACVLAAISFSALAMGLGEIQLNSWLNQRLDAEIELVSAAADEIESLEVTLADDAVYERYGLQRTALHNSVRFDVMRRPNGTAYIKVTSTEPIREPFLTLFVVADWSRGRLMREYTLLIDPPAFARREEPAPQTRLATGAPAIEPAEPVREPEPFVETPAPASEPAAPVEEEISGDVVSIPPLEADAEPVIRQPAYAEPETGGNYGPIQRNETLWGIARRLRPDDSVTINQMMLAIYRANPEAFQGNINRLKAGYILRIPEYGEITSVTSRSAFNEVKRQNEAWRAERAAPGETLVQAAPEAEPAPELTLVAPEEELAPEVGTGVGAGGEADDLGMGAEEAVDPAVEDVEEDAVDLGVEDDTQDRLLDLEDESMQALQEQETPVPAGETAAGEVTEESSETVEPPPLPLPGEETSAETGDPAATEPGAEEPAVDALPADEAPAAEETPVEQAPVIPAPRPAPEPGLVEKLKAFAFSPLGMGAGAAILVLLLAGFLVIRKRREATQAQAAAAMAAWDDEPDNDVTVIDGDDEDVTVVTGRDADGDDIATVFGHEMEHEDTGTTKLSDDDDAEAPLPDAEKTQMLPDGTGDEFVDTMVGGRAVTLDDNDPLSEADFHMAYGLYDQAAEVVQKAVERDPSRKEYHAKLAEIHFAGTNTEGFLEAARRLKELAGPGDADWDNVAIMGRQLAPNDPLFADGGSTASVDLDFGAAADEVAEADDESASSGAASADDSLDFDIDLGPGGDTEAETETAASDDSAEGLDFDLDIGGLDGNESGTEAATDEGAAPETADTGDAGDFDFDLGELDEPSSEAEDAPAEAGDELSEIGGSDEQTQTEFDKALEELSAFVDTNIPEQDAGDAVADAADSELNLDDYSFDEDASALGEESEGAGDDEEDIGEAGTKLDLARAYIDMGDPDGARGILEEVIADGDDDQQREARELLDQLA